ncbi:LacI family DNA-binding transcriptional regulator [Treponema pectinovorum]|uniref:LacI family DNA-binding transcriptional regulator n=1 Tax=Treponema pectinovorum TaxID=164 RepID=UPI0011CC4BDD|nr:LacI family DNA-binding transcriptional regulator [Treponema pectinovorum]
MAYTINDLAKECNVSIATISRVLNNSPKVSPKTKEKILQAMKEHNYSPNSLARGMKKMNMNIIGVLISDIANPFFTDIVKSIEQIAQKNDYKIFLCSTQNDIEQERKQIELLKQKQVDGFILAGSRPVDDKNEAYLIELSKNYPVVLINSFIEGGDKLYSVMVDEKEAAENALDLLVQKGYKNIYFFGDPAWKTTQAKIQALNYICKKYNLYIDDNHFINCEYGYNSGIEGINKLLNLNPKFPLLLFCASDQIAVGAKKALSERSIKIPEQVSILGFSNTVISALVTPTITTVDQKMYSMGEQAAKLFIKICNNKKNLGQIKKKTLSEYNLIQRESTI